MRRLLETIRNETRPIEGHSDPKALEDCWNEVFQRLDLLEKYIELGLTISEEAESKGVKLT